MKKFVLLLAVCALIGLSLTVGFNVSAQDGTVTPSPSPTMNATPAGTSVAPVALGDFWGCRLLGVRAKYWYFTNTLTGEVMGNLPYTEDAKTLSDITYQSKGPNDLTVNSQFIVFVYIQGDNQLASSYYPLGYLKIDEQRLCRLEAFPAPTAMPPLPYQPQ